MYMFEKILPLSLLYAAIQPSTAVHDCKCIALKCFDLCTINVNNLEVALQPFRQFTQTHLNDFRNQ